MVPGTFLQSHALFGGLSNEAVDRVLPLLVEESFAAGANIVNEGESDDRLYLICKGAVEVLKSVDTPAGKRVQCLAVLGVGDTFGEMELIDMQPRSATVRALENVSLVSLSNANLFEIYESNLETFTLIILNIAREISRRLRTMDALAGSSLYSSTKGRCPL